MVLYFRGYWLCLVLYFTLFAASCKSKAIKISKEKYLRQRSAFINVDWKLRTGGAIKLNDDERRVNETLMRWKVKEMEMGQQINGTFPPSMHFFRAKQFIDDSLVFRMIKKMPKGAALHIHDSAMADIHWVVRNATYDKNCYLCFDKTSKPVFRFFEKPPTDGVLGCKWFSVVKMRSQSGDPVKFDAQLYQNLTLMVDDPEKEYPTGDAAWARFQSLFLSLNGLVFYAPVFREFTFEALKEFYVDNVQYVEMRGLLPQVYDLDGTVHDKEYTVSLYHDVAKQFTQDHPDFIGLKIIATTSRTSSNKSRIAAEILEVIELRKKFPGFIVGYDIVGHEDRGGSLLSYIDALLYPSQTGIDLPYFFHAGETNFEGSAVDLNLFDAILLNTTRIGHGFAIVKHPAALDVIRQKDIPLEICPISNQVLCLVKDLRNHPAASLMAKGYPVVVSADDPGLWNATGLSYDFYEAFMGIGGMWADLATLKQLATDSIRYSGLSSVEKNQAFALWQTKWNDFIHQTLEDMS